MSRFTAPNLASEKFIANSQKYEGLNLQGNVHQGASVAIWHAFGYTSGPLATPLDLPSISTNILPTLNPVNTRYTLKISYLETQNLRSVTAQLYC